MLSTSSPPAQCRGEAGRAEEKEKGDQGPQVPGKHETIRVPLGATKTEPAAAEVPAESGKVRDLKTLDRGLCRNTPRQRLESLRSTSL